MDDTYYMVATTQHRIPGLTLLESRDLVNWSWVGHALSDPPPSPRPPAERAGSGVWAPALRFHAGRFWIFYGDPDVGIHVLTAESFRGPWSPPRLLKAGRGLIDPCPWWDDQGQGWLVHAWARSRAGFNNVLTLHAMTPDARALLDGGRRIIDGADHGVSVLEGPKIYRRDGYTYIFAPTGGIASGVQSVFRARTIEGPYEHRVVLAQGRTSINGPHQGAWVEAPDGSSWFLHFQVRPPFGRILHLQPMSWRRDWPVIGGDEDGDGTGEPLARHAVPPVASPAASLAPAASSGAELDPRWQWEQEVSREDYSLHVSSGHLRIMAPPLPGPPRLLSRRLEGPRGRVAVTVELGPARGDAAAGLAVLGAEQWYLNVARQGMTQNVELRRRGGKGGDALVRSATLRTMQPVELSVRYDDDARFGFAYREIAGVEKPLAEARVEAPGVNGVRVALSVAPGRGWAEFGEVSVAVRVGAGKLEPAP